VKDVQDIFVSENFWPLMLESWYTWQDWFQIARQYVTENLGILGVTVLFTFLLPLIMCLNTWKSPPVITPTYLPQSKNTKTKKKKKN